MEDYRKYAYQIIQNISAKHNQHHFEGRQASYMIGNTKWRLCLIFTVLAALKLS